jgi:4-amino-4-deoxy-L-arabinose transferase-like glycosyltransferase
MRDGPPVLAVLVLAAAVRLWGLTAQGVDVDESASLELASRPLWPLLFHNVDHGNPPLYYLLLKGWIALAGDGEAAIRLLSVIFSTAAVAAVYGFARALHGRAGALFAALLVALSPAQVAFARDARMYPLVVLLAVSSTHLLWLAARSGGRARWLGYAALAAAGAYTHHQGLVVIGAHAVALAVARPARPRLEIAVAALAVVALIIPIFPLYLAGGLLAPDARTFWQPHASLEAVAALATTWVAGKGLVVAGASWPAVLLALPAALAWAARARVAIPLVTLHAGMAAFVALAAVVPVWHERYLAAFHALFLLGLAPCARTVAAPFLVAIAAVGLAAAPATKQDWRGAARVVARPGTVLVLGPPYLARPLRRYRDAPFEVVATPEELVARAATIEGPLFVIYSDEHWPPDPQRRAVRVLASRRGLDAATDLVGLHVYELGPGAGPGAAR